MVNLKKTKKTLPAASIAAEVDPSATQVKEEEPTDSTTALAVIQVSQPLSAEAASEIGKAGVTDDADACRCPVQRDVADDTEPLIRNSAVVEATVSTPPEVTQVGSVLPEILPLVSADWGGPSHRSESDVEGKAVDDETVQLLPKR